MKGINQRCYAFPSHFHVEKVERAVNEFASNNEGTPTTWPGGGRPSSLLTQITSIQTYPHIREIQHLASFESSPCLGSTLPRLSAYRMTSEYSHALQTSMMCSFAKWCSVLYLKVALAAPCSCALWHKICSQWYSTSLFKQALKTVLLWIFTGHTVCV